MMKMNTSTRDMLVVAKNSITPFAAIGMFGKMVSKVPEPITDWMMPHVDGIAFTKQIHELEKYRDVPVIMMTAFGNDQVYDTGMRKGVAMTLSKPLELSKLLDVVGFATATPGSTMHGT